MGAKIRLISQPSLDGTGYRAGLHIALEDGWKTYWRSPGSSGLPPQISFRGSKNIAATAMRYPVPSAFDDASGKSAGYKGDVVFPISVTPLFAGQATVLKASGMVGICRDICVPVPFDITLQLGETRSTSAALARALRNAERKVPAKPAVDGVGTVRAKLSPNKRQLTVTATLPAGVDTARLFVASPSLLPIDPLPAASLSGQIVTFQKTFKKPLTPRDLGREWIFVLKHGDVGVQTTVVLE
ncbi:MAG: protein-disulfide reductase DsbD domain-containing protein [Pseudomonadota bacterium]